MTELDFNFTSVLLKRITDGQIEYQSIVKVITPNVKVARFSGVVRSMQSNAQICSDNDVGNVVTQSEARSQSDFFPKSF